jgi:molybdopterin/thiamine biosynthesis adenylyltransferase
VFWPAYAKRRGGCYRCMFPEPPPPEQAPSCAEIGVLGVLPGVLGVLQAVETIKVLLELGDPLVGKMLYYDALQGAFNQFKLARNTECRVCGDNASFSGYDDYAQVCSSTAP